MTKRPGERQANRSRTALKSAFKELLQDKSYGDISVGEIADRADIGRSTFYRHFNGKADVLIGLHEEIFGHIFLGADSREKWLSEEPSEALKTFWVHHHLSSGPMVSLSGDIGADADYLMLNVTRLLTMYIEKGLRQAFSDQESSVPLSVLASSIAGIYVMILMSWKSAFRELDGHEMARHVQRLTRAVVGESFDF